MLNPSVTPLGYSASHTAYLESVVQPLLDSLLPRIDLHPGLQQLCGYVKGDHEKIMQCFIDYIASGENWDDRALMMNIMRVGRGHFNPSVILALVCKVHEGIK